MKNILESLYKINDYVGIIKKDDRTIVLTLYTMRYLMLNNYAINILTELDNGITPDEIISSILDDNEENLLYEDVKNDILECINMFLNEKLIRIEKNI